MAFSAFQAGLEPNTLLASAMRAPASRLARLRRALLAPSAFGVRKVRSALM